MSGGIAIDELEIIPHHHISGIRIFINKIEYRSPHFHPDWKLLWVLDSPLSITGAQDQLLPLEDMLPVRSLHSREDIYDRSRSLNALQDFQHQLEQFV